jgi:hypothetical protein
VPVEQIYRAALRERRNTRHGPDLTRKKCNYFAIAKVTFTSNACEKGKSKTPSCLDAMTAFWHRIIAIQSAMLRKDAFV